MLQQWEPFFWQTTVAFELINSTTAFCVAPLPLYVLYLRYLLDVKVATISATRELADLFHYNTDRFLALNFRLLFGRLFCAGSSSSSSSSSHFRSKWRQIWTGKDDRWIKLQHSSLKNFPYVNRHVRVQAALMATCLELHATFVVCPSIGEIKLFIKIYIFYQLDSLSHLALTCCLIFAQFFFGKRQSRDFFFQQRHSLLTYLRLALDIAFFVWGFALSTFFLLFGSFIFLVGFFVHSRQLGEINAKLRRANNRQRKKQLQSKVSTTAYAALIERFRQLHHSILTSLYRAKVQFVDSTMLVIVLCNLQLNVFSAGRLLFERNLAPLDRLLLRVILFGEGVFVLFGGRMMLQLTTSLYAFSRYLHLAAVYLRKQLSDKLKMAAYYEVVHTTNRFCFSVGSFMRIDREHFISSLLLYTSYIFYVSKIVRKHYSHS